jgi:hypothetical protein
VLMGARAIVAIVVVRIRDPRGHDHDDPGDHEELWAVRSMRYFFWRHRGEQVLASPRNFALTKFYEVQHSPHPTSMSVPGASFARLSSRK